MTNVERSRLGKGISVVFAFFLSLFLFFLGFIVVVQSTVFSPEYLRRQLDKSRYYDHVMAEVEDEFVSYGSASGFDGPFFKTVLDINEVQLDVSRSIGVLYGESEGPEDVSNFESGLYSKLSADASGRGIALSAETGQRLRLLAKTCADTYIQYISIPYAAQLAPVMQRWKGPLFAAGAALLALIVLLAAAIDRLNRWRHRALRACLYAVFGAALMLSVFPAAVLISGRVGRIAVLSRSVYAFGVCYLNGILYGLLFCALGLAVVGLILGLFYRRMREKAYRAE